MSLHRQCRLTGILDDNKLHLVGMGQPEIGEAAGIKRIMVSLVISGATEPSEGPGDAHASLRLDVLDASYVNKNCHNEKTRRSLEETIPND